MNAVDPLRNLHLVETAIAKAAAEAGRPTNSVSLTVVSKTFDSETIVPVLETGQRIFGENRVQEAQGKWPLLRESYPDIELRLIGPLQSNKSKDAVALFDVIETVDREKIAASLAKEMSSQNRHLPIYVQVNTGEEPQKAGLSPSEVLAFVQRCREEHGLNVIGLMAIPPAEAVPAPHFALLAKLAAAANLDRLSMGMSADFEAAISLGATDVRVGSGIFGSRA